VVESDKILLKYLQSIFFRLLYSKELVKKGIIPFISPVIVTMSIGDSIPVLTIVTIHK
jgi:hypothetical protein